MVPVTSYEKLDRPTGFFVLFDSVNNRIGLQPTAAGVKDAHYAAKHPAGGSNIHAWRLISQCGIDIPQTVVFQKPDINDEGILVLDLRTSKVPDRVKNHFRKRAKSETPAVAGGLA